MKILRKQRLETKNIQIGDQIQVGKYTATCMKLTDKIPLFLLDQYLDKAYPMNYEFTNKGGYEASELRSEFKNILVDENFNMIRDYLVSFENGDLMRIPTVGEMFGQNNFCEMDNAEQWELMKERRNRIATRDGDLYEWGWLQNKVKGSAASFANVGSLGITNYSSASNSGGVRPVFQLLVH